MSRAHAALTPRARLRVAQLVVDQGYPISEVAARFQCSWPTVKRWAGRYARGESMSDRSSRPRHCPHKTPDRVAARVVSLRLRLREGPVQLAARTGIAPSTVHRIWTSARLNRLSHVDRATGEPVRRYEHDHPPSPADPAPGITSSYTTCRDLTSHDGPLTSTTTNHQLEVTPH